MPSYNIGSIAAAAKSGLGSKAALAAYRQGGGRIDNNVWSQLFSQVRTALAAQQNEITRPLDRRPVASEILPFPTQKATGYAQFVDVYTRDEATGLVQSRPYMIRTDTLLTRGDVIETALDAFQSKADDYGETVLGAAYVSTYLFGQAV